ncbi:hypothetical protein [Bradyrhizobium nitroreducens]|uniref:hypothetical protein n=1 Tax=Bradyrhizobium nitroreducens TaxID=709803 RepID=UPI001374AD3A|nr:hypothetical protein [Bradyrhizobium nitroreducens]
MTAPLIVSNARIEIVARNFMAGTSSPIVAKSVRTWRVFATIPGKIVIINSGFYGVFPPESAKTDAWAA